MRDCRLCSDSCFSGRDGVSASHSDTGSGPFTVLFTPLMGGDSQW
jgi:hypothetical protein